MLPAAKEKGKVRTGMYLMRGVMASIAETIILVLLFAGLVMLRDWGSEIITPVNQVIKVLSILCGTLAAAKGMKGWQAGVCVGALYMALGIVLYCAFAGDILPPVVMAGDMALGSVSGLLSGMLAGTLKRA